MSATILWQNQQLRIVAPANASSERPYLIQEAGDADLVSGEPMWFGVAPERIEEHLYTIIRGMAMEIAALREQAWPKTIQIGQYSYFVARDGVLTNGAGHIVANLMQQSLLALRSSSPTDTLADVNGYQIRAALQQYGDGVIIFAIDGPRYDPKPVFLRTVLWRNDLVVDVAGYPDNKTTAEMWAEQYGVGK